VFCQSQRFFNPVSSVNSPTVYDEWPWHSLTIWHLHIKGQIHESQLQRERGALICGESPLSGPHMHPGRKAMFTMCDLSFPEQVENQVFIDAQPEA
jgi:hypothetical protein